MPKTRVIWLLQEYICIYIYTYNLSLSLSFYKHHIYIYIFIYICIEIDSSRVQNLPRCAQHSWGKELQKNTAPTQRKSQPVKTELDICPIHQVFIGFNSPAPSPSLAFWNVADCRTLCRICFQRCFLQHIADGFFCATFCFTSLFIPKTEIAWTFRSYFVYICNPFNFCPVIDFQ